MRLAFLSLVAEAPCGLYGIGALTGEPSPVALLLFATFAALYVVSLTMAGRSTAPADVWLMEDDRPLTVRRPWRPLALPILHLARGR